MASAGEVSKVVKHLTVERLATLATELGVPKAGRDSFASNVRSALLMQTSRGSVVQYDDGPHQLIQRSTLRALWKTAFGSRTTCTVAELSAAVRRYLCDDVGLLPLQTGEIWSPEQEHQLLSALHTPLGTSSTVWGATSSRCRCVTVATRDMHALCVLCLWQVFVEEVDDLLGFLHNSIPAIPVVAHPENDPASVCSSH